MNKNVLFAVAPLVTWQGFVDTYYAWDFNRPETRERSYTTQPLKHDAFSINLAMLGAKIEQGKKRAVVTFQYGDSVDANYIAEPKEGAGIKHMQEAYAGIKLADDLWLDAGIYLGHIGNESWVSKDNWTYSRGLLAEFSPYYATGARLSGKNWQLHAMNGWQNIRENNSGKAIGTQYSWGKVTSNGFIGEEAAPGGGNGTRVFHDLMFELPGEKIDWKAALDLGAQRISGEDKFVGWGGVSSQWRYRWKEQWSWGTRLEYLHDERGVVAGTKFRVAGASVNLDHLFEEGALLRWEIRHLEATEDIYPGKGRTRQGDTFVTASLGLGF